jgi:LysM repeat protein
MIRLWTRLPLLAACLLLLGALPLLAQDTSTQGTTYQVKTGDTVISVAIQFDKSAECIRQANDLQDYGSIPGSVKELTIPDDCSTVLGQGGGGLADLQYTVQRGDHLSRIAAAFGVTVNCLAQANRIANPNLIYIGQELVITASCQGGGGGGTSTTSTVRSTAVCQFDRNPGRTAVDGQYTVQVGDSLDFIACDFGVSLECLTAANPQLENRSRLAVGETLTIDLSCPAWTAWPGAGELP